MLPFTVMANQTKNRLITVDDELFSLSRGVVMEAWQSCKLTTDRHHTGNTGSLGHAEVQKILLEVFEIATLNLHSIQKCIAREAS